MSNYNVSGDAPSGENSQRMEYSSSILFEKTPMEAMEALSIRHKQAKKINKEISDWLTNYGRLRLHYVDELKKIHEKGLTLFPDDDNDLKSLGLCTPLWSDLLKIVENEINLFDQSTRKMGRDMIAPLRLFTRNNDSNLIEMDQISEIASNLSNNPSLEEDWQRKAPYFFEIFENYDYQRLLLIKDIFSKYQTDLSDVLETFKKDNEKGLEHVLNFSPDDEIKRFSQKVIETDIPVNQSSSRSKNDSRTSPNGFTTSTALSSISPKKANKHHSTLFNHKKTEDTPAAQPEAKTSLFTKRLSSTTSMFSHDTASSNSDKKKEKEKHRVRSKFGSIFGRKKGKDKEAGYNPPSTIHEPDSVSISTETTNASVRTPITRARNQSVNSVLNNTHFQQRHESPSKLSIQPQSINQNPSFNRNSMIISNNNYNDSKELPAKPYSPTDSIQKSNNDEQQTPSLKQQQQQPSLHKEPSVNSLYEPMSATKKLDTTPAGVRESISAPASSESTTFDKSYSAPTSAPITNYSSPVVARGLGNIQESEPLSTGQFVPPPPPTSRKHLVSESANSSNTNLSSSRQPHGSAPIPPVQRKSMDLQQPLQPAATGSQQNDATNNAIARNTTGGGSLTGGQIMHPSLTTLGLNTSIVELFNATYKDGTLSRSNAIGEVAFSFISHNENGEVALPSEISLQIASKKGLELPNFMVNTMFLQQSSTPGFFTISDPAQIQMRTVGGLKYMLNSPTPPIVITPIWKHEPTQSTVIISVKPTAELDSFLKDGSITLTNFMISVSISGALVSTAATKPPGSLNKDKGRVTWVSPSTITFNSAKKEERFVARFITNQLATESDTGVQVRFSISNDDGAGRIDFLNTDFEINARGEHVGEDPFGDGTKKTSDEWAEVPTLKSLIAGTYSGHS